MKILVYKWGSMLEPMYCNALEELQIEYVEYRRELKNYHFDAEFAQGMLQMIHKECVQTVFSYDYFPLLAMLCEINKIPYMSWIYDCPQYTLWSKTLVSPYNYIFCFDRALTKQLESRGAVHCVHYPLAGDKGMLGRAFALSGCSLDKYGCDISFIGNLYNGKNNRFRKFSFFEDTKQYIEQLIEAQTMCFQETLIVKNLQKRTDIVNELVETCELSLGKEYLKDDVQLAADVLGMEVSAREREIVLKLVSEKYPVRLYTSSEIPGSLSNGKLEKMGYADYEKELPLIFHNSRINLNITSKTILSGIPQRVFDVLSCGGFCLTNYQKEIAEYFEDGKELVMFYDERDLIDKISYYLEHEEERKQIAINGYRTVVEKFELKNRVGKMFECIAKR